MKMTCEELLFAERVAAYCDKGLTQPEMARAEDLALGSFRTKLFRLGLEIKADTNRKLVRTRTSEDFRDLRSRGVIEITEPLPAAA